MSSPINYLLQTYIVTSKPKRISVADGFVHIIVSFLYRFCYMYHYTVKIVDNIENVFRKG